MLPWLYLTPLLLIIIPGCKAQEQEVCDEFTQLRFHHAFIGTNLKTQLLLYTNASATCGRHLSTNLSTHADFNLSRTTTFIIHGYRPSGKGPGWLGRLTESLLRRKDMNVVVVDWNYGAANLNYMKSVENARKAAVDITAFIQKMQEHGANLSSIHMIGVSLGAHISGFVGANLNGEIGRITALDPAGPQFTDMPPEDRLDPTDAQFVDALHTDIDALGFRGPLGHIDIYPNGGADQPGCPRTILSGSAYFKCDHQRSVYLFLESLERVCKLMTFPCSSYKDFLSGRCLDCDQWPAGCPVFGYDIIEWKDSLVKLNQSRAYFTTLKRSPFCMTTYKVEVVAWNVEPNIGYVTMGLYKDDVYAEAEIRHNKTTFNRYEQTTMLAQFDVDQQPVAKIYFRFWNGNAFKVKNKLRALRFRLTHLGRKEQRPFCRYDMVLKENRDNYWKPTPCAENEPFNF